MAKVMHPEHKESEQNEKQPNSQEYRRVEALAQKPPHQSNIPRRASAHPSAIATVRPKYPCGLGDLERITHLDVTSVPTLPQRSVTSPGPIGPTGSGVSQQRTDDPLTDPIFPNIEDIIPIDEIDRFPPDIQERLRLRLKRAVNEPSALSDLDTLPVSFVQGGREMVSQQVEARQSATTQYPTGIGQTEQLQGCSTWDWFDNVRWWLLSPGRLEFLLCLIGVIILVCLTSFFTLLIIVNMRFFGG